MFNYLNSFSIYKIFFARKNQENLIQGSLYGGCLRNYTITILLYAFIVEIFVEFINTFFYKY